MKIFFAGFIWLLIATAGVFQPFASLSGQKKLESFLRRNVFLSTSSSPFGLANGYDFNLGPNKRMMTFELTDGSNWRIDFASLTRSLRKQHREKIYWTLPLIDAAIYNNIDANRILQRRFCSQDIDQDLFRLKSEGKRVKSVSATFETHPTPLTFNLLCSDG